MTRRSKHDLKRRLDGWRTAVTDRTLARRSTPTYQMNSLGESFRRAATALTILRTGRSRSKRSASGNDAKRPTPHLVSSESRSAVRHPVLGIVNSPYLFGLSFMHLRMSAPQGHEDVIVECVEQNVADVAIKKIEPEDTVAYAGGNYEGRFRAHVFRSTNGGSRDGIVIVEAHKSDGSWQADHIQTTFS